MLLYFRLKRGCSIFRAPSRMMDSKAPMDSGFASIRVSVMVFHTDLLLPGRFVR